MGLRRQGAMVAVDLALDAPEPCAGVVALSGFVMCVEDRARKLQSKKGLRVKKHGLEDRDPLLHGALAPRTCSRRRRPGHVPADAVSEARWAPRARVVRHPGQT